MTTETRALDHFVVLVLAPDPAGVAWEKLGFQVLPKMRHLSVGSANRIIQLGHNYIELVGDMDRAIPSVRDHYLPRFSQGEGLANISFNSRNLEADRALIEQHGVRTGPITSARRPIVMPDGTNSETDSDFFYPERPGQAFMSPFLSMHKRPETIFTPEYQRHANTALDVIGVTCASVAPADDAAFFAIMASTRPQEIDGGFRLALAQGGSIDILTPDAIRRTYDNLAPSLPDSGSGFGVGLTVRVGSLEACRKSITQDLVVVDRLNSLSVPAALASGTFLRFVEA